MIYLKKAEGPISRKVDYEDISPNILSDKNYQASFQKFNLIISPICTQEQKIL